MKINFAISLFNIQVSKKKQLIRWILFRIRPEKEVIRMKRGVEGWKLKSADGLGKFLGMQIKLRVIFLSSGI